MFYFTCDRSLSNDSTINIVLHIIIIKYNCIYVVFGVLHQILKERVERLQSRSMFQWNSAPGALAVLPEFSQHDSDFPFYWRHQRPLVNGFSTASPLVNGAGHLVTRTDTTDVLPAAWFTAVVYVTTVGPVTSSSLLYRLVKTLGRSSHLHKVCLVTFIHFLLFLTFSNYFQLCCSLAHAQSLCCLFCSSYYMYRDQPNLRRKMRNITGAF